MHLLISLNKINEQQKMETTLNTITEKFANHLGYSDINPYEVVRVVSEKCVEIRAMDAEPIKWKKDIVQGGFSHHVKNQDEQKWDITSNEANPIIRIRLVKSGNRYDPSSKDFSTVYSWKDKYRARYSLSSKPTKFYDYNF